MSDTKRTMEINGVVYEGCYRSFDKNEYYCISPDGKPITDSSVLWSKWHNARRYITLTLPKPPEENPDEFWDQSFMKYETSAYNTTGKWIKNSTNAMSFFNNTQVYISYHHLIDGEEPPFCFCLGAIDEVDGGDLWWVSREFIEHFSPGGSSSVISGGVQIYYNGQFRKATPYILKDGIWKKATPYILKDGIWCRGI